MVIVAGYVIKRTGRSIRSFFGRYVALLLIVFLSVGFFAGLKVTRSSMVNTCESYLKEQNFYDYQLLSTLGFSESDVDEYKKLSDIKDAEGSQSVDALVDLGDSAGVYTIRSLPETINLPSLVAGRMPTADNECLVDDEAFGEEMIGQTISLSDENDKDTLDSFSDDELVIVGLVNSPLYLNDDRGSSSIGSGSVDGYLYLPKDAFTSDVYTEIFLTLRETAPIYTDAYDTLIDEQEDEVSDLCRQLADDRYDELLEESGLPEEMAADYGIEKPDTYVLTRAENAGYTSFENDSAILSGIANIFPLFFVLIAMLVCITTMTRMIDEERTQIGVLQALGYRNRVIVAKYLLYAGSATFLGWLFGFFLGTYALPQIFWFAYNSLYDFASMDYLFDPLYAVLTFVVSLVSILGCSYVACRRDFSSKPATLIRPLPPKNGKRIFLERITVLWSRLSFLQKVSIRNIFRYKRRLGMMLVGVGCCTALLVTAFGVRDSMIHIGSLQYEGVQHYQLEVGVEETSDEELLEDIKELDHVTDALAVSAERIEVKADETVKSVQLLSFDTKDLDGFWTFAQDGKSLLAPEEGEALICSKVADQLGLSVGDTIRFQDADMQTMSVTVSGIFDNYVDNFAVICADTRREAWDDWSANTIYVCTDGDSDVTVAEKLTELDQIGSVSILSDSRQRVENALNCLNYIICLIVVFAGALAFIVIFNLTNINLAERSREIATVEVLGFYPKETESYILRENLLLSVLAGVIGLPLGVLFHRLVMHMIVIDAMMYPITISWISYVFAFVCTIIFAVIVNLCMKRSIAKIHMVESLKAVE